AGVEDVSVAPFQRINAVGDGLRRQKREDPTNSGARIFVDKIEGVAAVISVAVKSQREVFSIRQAERLDAVVEQRLVVDRGNNGFSGTVDPGGLSCKGCLVNLLRLGAETEHKQSRRQA